MPKIRIPRATRGRRDAASATPLPPGWYPDPSGEDRQLYWDGSQWHTAPPPLPPPKKQIPVETWVTFVLGAVGLAIGVGACLADLASRSNDTSIGGDSVFIVRSCQDAIKKELRDPYSVKFSDDWTARYDTKQTGKYEVAGSLNSKNGFGGYTGSQEWKCDVTLTPDGKHSSTHVYPPW